MLLGGAKNMLLVMEDANLDVFVDNFLNSCYGSAGQRCLAGSIVAAVPEIYDAVMERILEASKTVKVGDAFDPDVYMGPLISRAAADNVAKYVDIALAHGNCELILDGRNPVLPGKNKNGFFVGPTIIRDVTPCNPLFTTEVFGPLVATIKVADMDDALNLIRASEFGNGVSSLNAYYIPGNYQPPGRRGHGGRERGHLRAASLCALRRHQGLAAGHGQGSGQGRPELLHPEQSHHRAHTSSQGAGAQDRRQYISTILRGIVAAHHALESAV